MDRREAIRVLRTMMLGIDTEEEIQSLDLAIEALEREIEYGQMVVDLTKGEKVDDWVYDDAESATISEKESVEGVAESATTTDCISRQEVLDLICDWISGKEDGAIDELVANLPLITPKVSEDCISREQAIEVLAHVKEDEQWRTECIDNEIRLIESLPPVTPTERTGEWAVEERDSLWQKDKTNLF